MNIHIASAPAWERTRLAAFIRRHGYASLGDLQERAAREPARFWDQVVCELGLEWATPYWQTVDLANGIQWPRWFVGGELDLVDNLVGKHARTDPHKIAVRWEGDGGELRTLSYHALEVEVARVTSGLAALGLAAGDRIGIWLPMVPEAAVLMLAATRLGVIFIPFFSGYDAESVAHRLRDCEAKVLVCANGHLHRGRELTMLDDARRAAGLCPSLRRLVVVDRLGVTPAVEPERASTERFEIDYRELLAAVAHPRLQRCYGADQPLMLIYTSDTTGQPRGVVHTHGGFPVKAALDLLMAFDLHDDDTLMWVADMGSLMGPWMVYGGLLLGATIVLYEGTADFPDARRLWQAAERHGVTHLGLSPSLVRLLMAMPLAVPPVERLAALRVFGSTGEAWNESPWLWLFDTVGRGRRPIINYSGGAEIGGGVLACFPGLPQKPGSFSGPIPGMAVDVLDEDGKPARGAVGELVIRQPWPGMTRGFWRDDARYEEAYWSTWPGLWVHGDWARVDEGGYWFVHGRSLVGDLSTLEHPAAIDELCDPRATT